MKYPIEQYNKLKESLLILIKELGIGVLDINIHTLHYTIYRQFAQGQRHNSFVKMKDGKIYTCHQVDNSEEFKHLFELDNSFKLYPNNTNDKHIGTAMSKVIKEIKETLKNK